jgi:GGDEF domain-containing protein
LTGLSNRRACEERCTVEIAPPPASRVALGRARLDGLKQINDGAAAPPVTPP